MKISNSLWKFIGFTVTVTFGTLLHFLYDWTDESIILAPFSAVNESTWEHMKLMFFPMFIFALIESRYFKDQKNFWCIKLLGTLTGLFLIPILFYTYNGMFGRSPDWVNIAIFFVSAAIAYIIETILTKKDSLPCPSPLTAFLFMCLIAVMFVLFTFYTPHIPLFIDPISKAYGLT